MTRVFLLLPLFLLITLSANAQWWWQKKHVERLPLLHNAQSLTFKFKNTEKLTPVAALPGLKLEVSQYNDDIAEAALMKSLYHTLRFHMNAESIESFNTLVKLYIRENRYSEAKWYLLQINYIARQQKDNLNIIASLSDLGMLKADIGEFTQARQDLMEASDYATASGRLGDVADIKKKLIIVEHKRIANVKIDVRYAELPEDKRN